MLDPNIEPVDAPASPDINTPPTMPSPTQGSSPMQGASQTPQAPSMSQEEMKADLAQMMSKINQKHQAFSQNNFTSKLDTKKQNDMVLQAIFDFFREVGVDPSDAQAVGDFLNKLKTTNTELYTQLMSVLQRVMGDDGSATTTPTTTVPPQGAIPTPPQGDITTPPNMNINTNEPPQQNI